MEREYSKEWIELLNRKKELERACFYYNKLSEEKRKQDLRKALKGTELLEQLWVIRMMGEGHLSSASIELVLPEVVECAVIGQEECAVWAGNALNYLDMKKWKNDIIQLVNLYTENNLEDEVVFHYSWHLLYKLGFKQALIDYIRKYEKFMIDEFDEMDWLNINCMMER